MLSFTFTDVNGEMTEESTLTSGMAGRTVDFHFDSSWAGLTKTAVFLADDTCRTAPINSTTITIPRDVLVAPHRWLYVGAYGVDDSGDLVIPTILVKGPWIHYGADPTIDPVAVDLPVWQSLQEQIGQLDDLTTEARDSLVAAINELAARVPAEGIAGADGKDGADGVTFTPTVTEAGLIYWSNNGGLPNPRPMNIKGPQGEQGESGPQGAQGPQGEAGPQGEPGADGTDGYTPVRGTDYWTEADIAEIKAYVEEAILGGAW